MYVTRLLLNPKSRRVRQEVARPYEMHRTLMCCFLDNLSPGEERVLFRVETDRHTEAITALMQSVTEPSWDWLDEPGARGYLVLTDDPNPWVKTFKPKLKKGQIMAFRLLANPTVKRAGKRLGLYRDRDQRGWLQRKAQQGGFRVLGAQTSARSTLTGTIHRESGRSHRIKLVSVRFDGYLQVTDPDLLLQSVRCGIASGKGLGFGLLSLAKPQSF